MRFDHPDARTRILLDDAGHELGRVHRTTWFGHEAELLTQGRIHRIETENFRSRLQLTYDGTPMLEVTFPWRGGVLVKDLSDPSKQWTVEQQSIWRSGYQVKDANGAVLATFRSVVMLDAADAVVDRLPVHVLLTAVYAMNVKRSRQAAAASV
jgi:hypothetical protein